MKPDSSRKKLFEAKMHEKKALLHVHVSKSLKTRMKAKKRSLLVKKGDKVRVMRGSLKGKEGKVAKVNYNKSILYVEGFTVKTSKGKEEMVPLQPSNLMLVDVDMGGSRKDLFTDAKSVVSPKTDKVEKPVKAEVKSE